MAHSYSPLRYPGGKSKLSAYVSETIRINNLEGGVYVEPFAGGAAIAWYLLKENIVSSVCINDLNPSIYAFWHSVLYQTNELCELIDSVDVTIDEWHYQKSIQSVASKKTLLELGFSTFFLNRTNRSGIIGAGVVGGLKQDGNYKIDCRFNKSALIEKIQGIAVNRDVITLTNLDAVDFIGEVLPGIGDKALVNLDPPYYVKGKGLYQNFFEHDDHVRLFNAVRHIKQPWIVTYDDTPEIREIYEEYSPQSYGLSYTAQDKRRGAEVVIHKPNVEVVNFKPDLSVCEFKKLKPNEKIKG